MKLADFWSLTSLALSILFHVLQPPLHFLAHFTEWQMESVWSQFDCYVAFCVHCIFSLPCPRFRTISFPENKEPHVWHYPEPQVRSFPGNKESQITSFPENKNLKIDPTFKISNLESDPFLKKRNFKSDSSLKIRNLESDPFLKIRNFKSKHFLKIRNLKFYRRNSRQYTSYLIN